MKRVPDVIDCWYDSGSASFAQFHYPFEIKKNLKKDIVMIILQKQLIRLEDGFIHYMF
jgi:isoleucyl-tRNA synthetase